MIFATWAEKERVMAIVKNRQTFTDLTEEQNNYIKGIYDSILCLENDLAEYRDNSSDKILETLQKEIAVYVLENAIENLESEIAETYVSFSELNTMEDSNESN